jgi:hypothetical protein
VRLLLTGGDGTPLLEAGPKPLDAIPVPLDPVTAGNRGLVLPGRYGRCGAEIAAGLAERVAGLAAIGHGPERRPGQADQQAFGLGQLGGLAWGECRRNRSAAGIGERPRLGPVAVSEAAKGLSLDILLRRQVPPWRRRPSGAPA